MNEYPRTLEAVERAELSLWPVVDALVDEVETIETARGREARRGEYGRVATYLAEHGYRTWSDGRLKQLHTLGAWVSRYAGRNDFASYPVERVIEARAKAKSDHDEALALLATVKSKRDLRPDRATPAQIVAGLRDESTRSRVLAMPEGIAAVERASIDAHSLHGHPADRSEPLPEPSRFGSAFWRLVQYAGIAYEQMEQHGLGSLVIEPEAREAAERMRRQAAEIAAAVAEAVVESSITQEV